MMVAFIFKLKAMVHVKESGPAVEKTYYFSKKEKTWTESKKSCQDLGASLIKIDDREEQVCLLYYI